MQSDSSDVVSYLWYSDEQLSVSTGIDIKQEVEGLDRYPRTLNNAIKITATSKKNDAAPPNIHFIQFVTRQLPNLMSFEKYGICDWDNPAPHYMTDLIAPKWKVDTTDQAKTCFYEELGAKRVDRGENHISLSMYDYPGGAYEPVEERVVFCTFVMIDDAITHVVQWDKKYNLKEEEYYLVKVTPWHKPLPYWAVDKLKDFYASVGAALPATLASQDFLDKLSRISIDDINHESRKFLLETGDDWYIRIKMAKLFSEPSGDELERDIATLNAHIEHLTQAKLGCDKNMAHMTGNIRQYQVMLDHITDEIKQITQGSGDAQEKPDVNHESLSIKERLASDLSVELDTLYTKQYEYERSMEVRDISISLHYALELSQKLEIKKSMIVEKEARFRPPQQ